MLLSFTINLSIPLLGENSHLVTLRRGWFLFFHALEALLEKCVLLFLVPHHRRRPLRSAHCHRARSDGRQSGGDWEKRLLLPEQRAAPLALHHSRPARPRGQEVLWQILCRSHRPHQWVSDYIETERGVIFSSSLTRDDLSLNPNHYFIGLNYIL